MARGDFPSAKQDQFVLRLPDGMRDTIKEAADHNGRSMNAEIVARLEASFDPSANKDDQIEWLTGYLEQQQEERSDLLEALNGQERLLQKMADGHRTLTILAKAIGDAFLSHGDRSDILTVLAAGLRDVEPDLSNDPSEELPKQPWE
ncbi:Arc family DNA-binding protein [Sinorhizobium fredii]|uniref:Arc family DNA-binding protein n=1 Tax=Rhizobium fredii TaxID=380 RepID=UPI0005955F7E|nr:Arc family DNA-binding protein [Sinorhizobium fredii]WOS62157.1 Arc family DNA-binding protein [Sinorhizobium fredii GR64]